MDAPEELSMRHSRLTLLVFTTTFTLVPAVSAQDFGYFGEDGPPHWAELTPDFAVCGSGEEQSPVDFSRRALRGRTFNRVPASYGSTEGEIFDTGHTIEVETEGHNVLTLDGIEFELVQFHFHTPSEHTIRGRGADLEVHLVHRSAAGELAVVGVLIRRGKSSGALAPFFELLPDEPVGRQHLTDEFDPADFLPSNRANYRYRGSLTTPPCTEGVRWIVLADTVTITDEHMARFAERVHFNSRPVQRRLQ